MKTREHPFRTSTFIPVVAGILALAVGLRVFGLTREAFWVDEVITFRLTGQPGLANLKVIAEGIHPPLYFLGLAQWRAVFAHSEFAIRAFSVVWSVIGVVATMLFAGEVGRNRRTATWALLLAAISPLSVYFAQETRMYAQAAALVALSSWALLAWINRSAEGRPTAKWAVLYVFSVAALLLTHHVTVVVAVSQGMAAVAVSLVRRDRRFLLGYLAAAGAVAVLFLPWLNYVHNLRSSLYQAASLAWIPSPGWRDIVLLFTRDLVWGSPGWVGAAWPIAQGVSLVLIVTVVWALWSDRPRGGETPRRVFLSSGQAFVMWMAVGPVLLALVVSWLYHPVLWVPRFCILVLPPVVVLAASAIDAVRDRKGGIALPVVLVTTALVGLVSQHLALTKAGMRDFAQYWQLEGAPDIVCFFPEWKRMVARYELPGLLPRQYRKRLDRRLDGKKAFTLWVCSTRNYDSIWRPDRERAEKDRLLSLGPRRHLDVVDRLDIVEVQVSPGEPSLE